MADAQKFYDVNSIFPPPRCGRCLFTTISIPDWRVGSFVELDLRKMCEERCKMSLFSMRQASIQPSMNVRNLKRDVLTQNPPAPEFCIDQVRIWSVRKRSAQSIMRRSLVFPTLNRIKRSKTCCGQPIKMMSGSVSIQIRKSRLEMVHKMRPSIRGRQAAVRASVAQTGRLIRTWTKGGVQAETF